MVSGVLEPALAERLDQWITTTDARFTFSRLRVAEAELRRRIDERAPGDLEYWESVLAFERTLDAATERAMPGGEVVTDGLDPAAVADAVRATVSLDDPAAAVDESRRPMAAAYHCAAPATVVWLSGAVGVGKVRGGLTGLHRAARRRPDRRLPRSSADRVRR